MQKEKSRPFICWRSEYTRRRLTNAKYQWCEEALRQPTDEQKLHAEWKHLIPGFPRHTCKGDGSCYALIPNQVDPLPSDTPFKSFIPTIPSDVYQFCDGCELEKCKTHLCDGLAPVWYKNKNSDLCFDCVNASAAYAVEIRSLATCIVPSREESDDTWGDCGDLPIVVSTDGGIERIDIPFLYEVLSSWHQCYTCAFCPEKTNKICVFTTCSHRICLNCASLAYADRAHGDVVCRICVTRYLASCVCGHFQRCSGQCLAEFNKAVETALRDEIAKFQESPLDTLQNSIQLIAWRAELAVLDGVIAATRRDREGLAGETSMEVSDLADQYVLRECAQDKLKEKLESARDRVTFVFKQRRAAHGQRRIFMDDVFWPVLCFIVMMVPWLTFIVQTS